MLKATQRIGDNIFPSSGNTQHTEFNVHFLHLSFNFNYSAFDMFRTSKFHPQEELYMQFMVFLSCIHIRSLVDGGMPIWMHDKIP